MTLRIHAFDNASVFNIDLAFLNTVTGDKKCCLGIVALELVKNVLSKPLLRPVVVGQSYSSRFGALEDSSSTIRHRSNLDAWD